jgi:hypothetical protein
VSHADGGGFARERRGLLVRLGIGLSNSEVPASRKQRADAPASAFRRYASTASGRASRSSSIDRGTATPASLFLGLPVIANRLTLLRGPIGCLAVAGSLYLHDHKMGSPNSEGVDGEMSGGAILGREVVPKVRSIRATLSPRGRPSGPTAAEAAHNSRKVPAWQAASTCISRIRSPSNCTSRRMLSRHQDQDLRFEVGREEPAFVRAVLGFESAC